MLPPQGDGRRWFSARYFSFTVTSSHGGGRVHDFMHGWGLFSPDGKWFSWDSGRLPWYLDPKGVKPVVPKFDKWIFPVIKNFDPNAVNLSQLFSK